MKEKQLSCWLKAWHSFQGDVSAGGRRETVLLGAPRSAVGWCNNKALSRPASSDAFSVPPPHLPTSKMQVQSGQVKHGERTPPPPSAEEHLVPKEGKTGSGKNDAAPSLVCQHLCSSFSLFYSPTFLEFKSCHSSSFLPPCFPSRSAV